MTNKELKKVLLALGVQAPEIKVQLRDVLDLLDRHSFSAESVTARRKVFADVPEKYKHIDFKPPQSVADAAERGLELRREQKGDKAGLTPEEAGEKGIGSGVQRAVNLKNRDTLSPETINDMVGFFARFSDHIKDARKLKKKEKQLESNMYVSDLLWGGEPGEKWANKIKKQMEKADEKAKESSLRVAFQPKITPNLKQRLIHEVGEAIRQALLNVPTKSPRQILKIIAGDLVKLYADELPPGYTLSGQSAYEFMTYLVQDAEIVLTFHDVKDALKEITGDENPRVEKKLVKHLSAILNKSIDSIARNPDRGGEKGMRQAVRLLARQTGVEDWAALQVMDEVIKDVLVQVAMDEAEIAGLLGTFLKKETRVAAQNTYYHITYAKNLPGIASNGLVPGRGSNFGGGYSGHSSGRIFLSGFRSIRFWIEKLWNVAEHSSDSPVEDGWIPVALKVTLPDEVASFLDEAGARDSRGDAVYIEERIPPRHLRVWTGESWEELSSGIEEDIIAEAKEVSDVEEEDGLLLYWFDGDHFRPKRACKQISVINSDVTSKGTSMSRHQRLAREITSKIVQAYDPKESLKKGLRKWLDLMDTFLEFPIPEPTEEGYEESVSNTDLIRFFERNTPVPRSLKYSPSNYRGYGYDEYMDKEAWEAFWEAMAEPARGFSTLAYFILEPESQLRNYEGNWEKFYSRYTYWFAEIQNQCHEAKKLIEWLLDQMEQPEEEGLYETFTWKGIRFVNQGHTETDVRRALDGIAWILSIFKKRGMETALYQGVREVVLSQEREHFINERTKEQQEAAAHYYSTQKKIVLRPDTFDRGSGRLLKRWLAEVFLHEFGHHIHLSILPRAAKEFWDSGWQMVEEAQEALEEAQEITQRDRQQFFKLIQKHNWDPNAAGRSLDGLDRMRFIAWLHNNDWTGGVKRIRLTSEAKNALKWVKDTRRMMLKSGFDEKDPDFEQYLRQERDSWLTTIRRDLDVDNSQTFLVPDQMVEMIRQEDSTVDKALDALGIPSEYGKTNVKEDFAETFVLFMVHPNRLHPVAKWRMGRTLGMSQSLGTPIIKMTKKEPIMPRYQKLAKIVASQYLKACGGDADCGCSSACACGCDGYANEESCSCASKTAKNLPKSVERYVKEHKEQGMDEGKAWAIAWSRYCQFKNPDSPHCKQKDYFPNRDDLS